MKSSWDAALHGARVLVGGRPGVLLRCESKTGRGHYWKVKCDDGTWAWPDGVMAESKGAYQGQCTDCGLPYRTDAAGRAGLCPNCIKALDKATGAESAYHGPSHQFGRRPRR